MQRVGSAILEQGMGNEKASKVSQDGGDRQPDGDRKTVFLVVIMLVIDLLAFTMILPLLPTLLDYYGEHDESGLYDWLVDKVADFRDLLGAPDTRKFNSVLFGGLVGSLFSLLQFLASPVIGALSDVYGRKPMMLLSMVGVAISYGVWALSSNFLIFVLARVIGGISKGNVSLSTAIVTDVSTPKTRGRGMAMIGVAFSVGFTVGPMIGAAFTRMSTGAEGFYIAPALFALTLAVIDILVIFVAFKETLPAERRSKSLGSGVSGALDYINPVSLFRFSAVQQVSVKDKVMMARLGLIYFLYLFLYSGLEFTLTFLTHMRYHYTSMQQGKMFCFIGIIMALVQGGYVRRVKAGNEKRTALMGLILVIPSFVIIGIGVSPSIFYVGLALYSFSSATVVPCITTMISSYGSTEQKGTMIGIFRSLGALARALGPFVACGVYWIAGPMPCYTIGAALLFFPLLLLHHTKM
ncbi:PREDICTED: major facilitator superfamily domain-containing protein 10-like [Priapulus caudatus]|uniref:Major facilitator superfamily domain-containing protein 10-like n=1 Tax=Priapulus caudatus TaxID=37621 RepID=A0ABM1FBA9_PRICU|nr:PREDICTED: major facilitator superfamily domain-containing protein 10-like [Priapulus caudatus]